MNLPVQHLSDEAVAAFADGMLATAAHNRATRHIAQCDECASAVDEQRAAVSALRAAPEPALPAGLLERLRAVPVTTSLTPRAMALAPDGSAVFPAFGTTYAFAPAPVDPVSPAHRRHEFHLPVAVPRVARRTQQVALVAAAAAVFTVAVAASASANTASSGPSTSTVPGRGNPVVPAGYSTDRSEFVGATLTGVRH